jgi:ribosomal protein S27E
LVSIEANQSFDEAMSCVSARMSVEGSQVATELVPTFVEYVKPIIAEMKARIPAGRKPTEDEQAIMVASMIRREHQEEFGPVFSRALVNNIGLGADFLGHSLLKFGIETRQRHVAATTGVLEYDAMVKALERTQVFAPRARVVLCDQCWNLEVAFGRHAGTLAKCTKCGAGVSTMSLLFPTAEFQRLKLDSIDLPLFAAAFFLHKAMLPTSIAACRTISISRSTSPPGRRCRSFNGSRARAAWTSARCCARSTAASA